MVAGCVAGGASTANTLNATTLDISERFFACPDSMKAAEFEYNLNLNKVKQGRVQVLDFLGAPPVETFKFKKVRRVFTRPSKMYDGNGQHPLTASAARLSPPLLPQ